MPQLVDKERPQSDLAVPSIYKMIQNCIVELESKFTRQLFY